MIIRFLIALWYVDLYSKPYWNQRHERQTRTSSLCAVRTTRSQQRRLNHRTSCFWKKTSACTEEYRHITWALFTSDCAISRGLAGLTELLSVHVPVLDYSAAPSRATGHLTKQIAWSQLVIFGRSFNCFLSDRGKASSFSRGVNARFAYVFISSSFQSTVEQKDSSDFQEL